MATLALAPLAQPVVVPDFTWEKGFKQGGFL